MSTISKKQKGVVFFDRKDYGRSEYKELKEKKTKNFEEAQFSEMVSRGFDKNIARAVFENDKDAIDNGNLIAESLNQGISSFNPSMLFEQIVSNFSFAKQLYGETLIRIVTGHDVRYIEKNIKVPELQKELKKRIEEKIQNLRNEKIIDEENNVTEKGIELASLVTAVEELNNLIQKGYYGERTQKKKSFDGEKDSYKNYKKGMRYRDIAIRRSVKLSLRRGHHKILTDDLMAFSRQRKGRCRIIYGIDCSGSMRGEKIENAKKAGIALAYKAINEGDKVGLILFGECVRKKIAPTNDFPLLLKDIIKAKAAKETNIVVVLKKSAEMFGNENVTKHLILITDALPTSGIDPENETIESAINAREAGITISVVGISLDEKGKKIAEKIVDIGKGRLYITKNIKNLDKIVLEDYYKVA